MSVSGGNIFLYVCGGLICLGLVVLLLWGIASYNKLVRQRNQVQASWAQIDVQLKRRYDLIPNLVETVKGYAAHEKGTLEAVIQARNGAVAASGSGPAGRAEAENMLTQTLGRLFALAEAYPNLKANENFMALQSELTGTEDKIAYSRQFYNSAVQSYNNATQTIPTNIIAGMMNFKTKEYFETSEGELSATLSRLLAVTEAYPDLKANQNFLALQEELTGTESKIAYARQFYNDQVALLNTLVQKFPANVIAGLGHFEPKPFFEIDEPVRGPVQVDI